MNKTPIKKARALFLITINIFVFSFAAAAENYPAKKAARGLINIALSPLEIPINARRYWKKGAEKTDHILVWIACGIVKGVVEMTKRIGTGACDILTAPVNWPEDNRPIMKPEYVINRGSLKILF